MKLGLTLLVLTAAELMKCIEEWEAIAGAAGELFSTERSVYGNMFAYSGHWLNDLGRYHKCTQLSQAKYVVLEAGRRPWVVFAFCGPKSCTKSDYYSILQGAASISLLDAVSAAKDPVAAIRPRLNASPAAAITVHFPSEYINDHSDIHGGAIAMLVFIAFLLSICFAATAVDLWQRGSIPAVNGKSQLSTTDSTLSSDQPKRHTSQAVSILLCFSLYTNFQKLTQAPVSRSGENFSALNGVRVLSIGWVILGHVYSYRAASTPLANIIDIPDIIDKPKFSIVHGAFFAVDTFFWLGGFLVSYMMVKEIKAKGKISWFMVYFHRFWRLVPLFMFVTFLVWAFQGYAGDGPMWFKADDSSENCADYWWTNLIFLNNFIPNFKRSYCIVVGWYMANDMQFYIISPPLLYVYAKFHRGYGWVGVALLCVICVVTSAEIADRYNLNIVLIASNNSEYMWYYYVKPYCRVAPYALGLASGFVVHEIKQYEKSGKVWDDVAAFVGKIVNHVVGAWVVFSCGVGLVTLIIFIQFQVWKTAMDFDAWNHTQRIQFLGWSRLTYGFGISFILLPVLLGRIRPADWFLSLPVWSPLAKLTFSVYLIHLTIVDRLCLGTESAYYLGDLQIFTDLLMFASLSYLVAMCISLVVESPVMALEKVLFHREPRSRAKKLEE